jgi:hypothetical protein
MTGFNSFVNVLGALDSPNGRHWNAYGFSPPEGVFKPTRPFVTSPFVTNPSSDLVLPDRNITTHSERTKQQQTLLGKTCKPRKTHLTISYQH